MMHLVLLHGTSRGHAASIQLHGFKTSPNGYFGPAVYFYLNDAQGPILVRMFLDQKIENRRITCINECVVIICQASCDEEYFLDATDKDLMADIERQAREARRHEWDRMNRENSGLTHDQKMARAKYAANSARNDYIRRFEEAAGVHFQIFKGRIARKDPCVAIRNISCLSNPPYTLEDYHGCQIAC